MKSIKRISSPVWVAVAALALSACGGGGGSSSPSNETTPTPTPTTTPKTLSGVNGFKVTYDGASYTGTSATTGPVSYTSATGLNSFTVADTASPAHTFSGVPFLAGTFATIGSSQLGGTKYAYSRFGWMYGQDGVNTGNYSSWYTPFALASTTPVSPVDAKYAGTQQALVYLHATATSQFPGISGYAICDTSASYTASSKSLQLNVSKCTQAVSLVITGGVTLANGTGSTTLNAVKIQPQPTLNNPATTMTSSTVDSGNFLLAGPNGEELVGAATVKGSIALSDGTGSSSPALFFVVFGGQKQ